MIIKNQIIFYAFAKKAKEFYYRFLQIEIQQGSLDDFEQPTFGFFDL